MLGTVIAARIPTTVIVISSSTSVKPQFPTNGGIRPMDGKTTGLFVPMNGCKGQIKGATLWDALPDLKLIWRIKDKIMPKKRGSLHVETV
jgi:hypothetical protein